MNNIKKQYLQRFVEVATNHYDDDGIISYRGMEELVMLVSEYSNLTEKDLFVCGNRLNPSVIDDFCSFIVSDKESYMDLCHNDDDDQAADLFTKICFYLDMRDLWLKDDCFGYFLVFPGMGKTTLTRNPQMLRIADCDFGHLRRSLYNSPDDFKSSGNVDLFYKIYTGLASSLSTENDLVLLNDFHPFKSADSEDIQRIRYMFIPQVTDSVKSRFVKGIADRGHNDFAELMEQKFDKWIRDWRQFARDNQIDCVMSSIYIGELINLTFDSTVSSLMEIINSIRINEL